MKEGGQKQNRTEQKQFKRVVFNNAKENDKTVTINAN